MGSKFSIGDRVVFIYDTDPDEGVKRYMTGTVCNLDDYDDGFEYIGVCWDSEVWDGHNCGGSCAEGHGWNVPEDMIDFLTEEFDMEPSDADDLLHIVVGV